MVEAMAVVDRRVEVPTVARARAVARAAVVTQAAAAIRVSALAEARRDVQP
jgi:hypothetical protein